MKKIALIAFLMLTSISSAYAGVVKVFDAGLIGTVQAFSTYGTGIVLIKFSPGVTGCTSGVYIDGSDAGGKEALSVAIAAYMSDKEVTIYGNTDESWSGQQPAGTICHLNSIRFGS